MISLLRGLIHAKCKGVLGEGLGWEASRYQLRECPSIPRPGPTESYNLSAIPEKNQEDPGDNWNSINTIILHSLS